MDYTKFSIGALRNEIAHINTTMRNWDPSPEEMTDLKEERRKVESELERRLAEMKEPVLK